jgi:hypothetical protein
MSAADRKNLRREATGKTLSLGGAGPAPAAQHFVPVAFDRPMDLLQGTKVSGNAV